MKNNKKLQFPTIGDWIRHIFLGWLVAAFMEYLLLPDALRGLASTEGLAAMSLMRVLIVTVMVTIGLAVVSCFYKIEKIERWSMTGIFLLLACMTLDRSYSNAYLAVCGVVTVVFVVYAIQGHDGGETKLYKKQKVHWRFSLGVAIAALLLFAILCIWSISRVLSFSAPNFDFGIFSQMFYNMKETGLPTTTVERAGELSHFKVHVSPIYYLMLPFYMLFPDPITLQVLQAAVLVSAVIPMWLLAKQYGFNGWQRLLACLVLLLIPTTAGGIYYDLHENCFLLPLVLWLMYAIDRRSILLTCLIAFLTLMVKEDAAVYVAVAAIYLIVRTAISFRREKWKDLILGVIILAAALVWFKLVTDYLANQGDGVMTYRYDNFMYGDSDSLIRVVFAVIMNPMKMLFESVDSEKLQYIGQTMLPLLFLPLLTRKFERYILLIPYILINLMSDYQYQHNILFQYNFGSSALLLYLVIVNVADIKKEFLRIALLSVATAICLFNFSKYIVPQAFGAYQNYRGNRVYYEKVQESLDLVPDDASVTAHTYYVVPLSDRKDLYDVRYCSLQQILETEYVVLRADFSSDFRRYAANEDDGYAALARILKSRGYEQIHENGSLVIYYRDAE